MDSEQQHHHKFIANHRETLTRLGATTMSADKGYHTHVGASRNYGAYTIVPMTIITPVLETEVEDNGW